jgi:Lar family restriction alleviation protein
MPKKKQESCASQGAKALSGLNLFELSIVSVMPEDVYHEIKKRIELALTCLEDGRSAHPEIFCEVWQGDKAMPELTSCPFCGSGDIKIDSLIGRTRRVFRAQCQTCLSSTAWKDAAGEAAADWNTRFSAFMVQAAAAEETLADCLLGKNRFQFEGNAYERDPRSGFCCCFDDPLHQEGRNAKWRRIARAVYAEKYKACSMKLANKGGKL